MRSIMLHNLVTQDTRRQLLHLERRPGMKKDMAEYISRCMKCQQVKVENQKPSRFVASFASSRMEMGSYFDGFYYKISNDLETT